MLVILGTLLVLGPGLVGDFIWDDHDLITSNNNVRDVAHLLEALRGDFWHTSYVDEVSDNLYNRYYRPVVTLAYALQFWLFGEDALGYHAVNLALHVANATLVWAWLRRRVPGAAAAISATAGAALFAMHPSRPESVTWISGSTDLWMALWLLLGLTAWDRGRRWLAAALFALAVFSKEAALVVPVLLAADALLLPSPDAARTRLRRVVPAFVGVAAAVALRAAIVPLRAPSGGPLRDAPVARVLASFGHYLRQVAWPWPPSLQVGYLTYDATGLPQYAGWAIALGAAGALGFVALAALAVRRPGARPWLADACWFVVALAPVVNLVPLHMNVLVAARFLYLPLMGVAALAARAVHVAWAGTPVARRATGAALLVAVAASGLVSIQHCGNLLTDETLWSWEHEVNPDNAFAADALAAARMNAGRTEGVLRLLGAAHAAAVRANNRYTEQRTILHAASTVLKTTPDADQATLRRLRDFYDGLHRDDGRPVPLVAPELRLTLALRPGERERLPYRIPRAVAYARTLDFAEAERQSREVLARTPDAYLAWRNLILIHAALGRWDEAVRASDEAIRRCPDDRVLGLLRAQCAATRERLAGVTDPWQRALVEVESVVALRMFELARRRLAPLREARPERPEPVALQVRAELGDAQYDRARALLQQAQASFPQDAARWSALARELPPAPAPAPSR